MTVQTDVLIATDLDRTLIYSVAAFGKNPDSLPELTAVERYDGQDFSFVTKAAGDGLMRLGGCAVVVPVTTRTPAQLARVRLPGPAPRFAVAANGGVLLADGAVDAAWSAQVSARLSDTTPLARILDELQRLCRPEWTHRLRTAEGLFCYAVIDRTLLPAHFLDELTAWAQPLGWSTSLQGRKLYLVPEALTKSAAVREVAERLGSRSILAAGDSLLDIDLLELADRGIAPRHGELYASGWTAEHVDLTAASGILAGEEIVEWFCSRCPS